MNEIKELGNLRLDLSRKVSLGLEDVDERNTLSSIIDALIKFIKRFITEVGNGTVKMSINLGQLHTRAEKINTDSRARGRINRKETFKIETRIKNLSVNYRAINDPQQLLLITKSTDPLIKGYFKYQNIDLPAVIPKLITIDPRREDSVYSMVELLSPVSPIVKAGQLGMTGDLSTMSSQPLLGNVRFHALSKNANGDAYENLCGQEWLITAVSDNPKPLPGTLEFKVFASTIEQSMLRQITATVSDIEANFGIVSRNRRSSRIDDLTRYLENLRNHVNGGQLDPETQDRANQLIQLLNAYSHWLISPYLNLMALYINNTTALLNVCEANN